MAVDDDFKARALADTTLMGILLGKFWASSDLKTKEGIDPETTADAFDSEGKLLPCGLAIARSEVADGWVQDLGAQLASTVQVVMLTLYQYKGWDAIDAGLDRLYLLFHGHDFADGRSVEFVGIDRRLPRDAGALKDSSAGRIDFAVFDVKGA